MDIKLGPYFYLLWDLLGSVDLVSRWDLNVMNDIVVFFWGVPEFGNNGT